MTEAMPIVSAPINELDVQITTAKAYPRNIKNCIEEANYLATLNEETAAACFYCLPRSGKKIQGPSARLAEILAHSWGNIHAATRILGTDGKYIIAQAVAWDLEKNVRISTEVKRRITTSDGKLYNDDMQVVTGNAAASIALRNAIFKVIPKAFYEPIYQNSIKVAVGEIKSFKDKLTKVIDRLKQMGTTEERILNVVNKKSIDELLPEDLETLIGLGTALKEGTTTLEEAFPEIIAPKKIISSDKNEEKINGLIDKIENTKENN